ncbi:MAG: beta-lactamase family protein [Candidatus Kaiserbacteria bacterium]|nr:beta-lactamase family protein [Candidatus Kaiserbacteria bacterium]
MLEQLKARAEEASAERIFPGCVIGLMRDDEQLILPFGTLAYGEEIVRSDTVYDLASVTKSIPTASLALLLIEDGMIALNDSVKKYIPELANDYGATIEDLLRYRVRGIRMSTLPFSSFEEVRTAIFESGFTAPPGESSYTNLPAFLIGIVLERVTGASLAALADERLFGPLEMRATTFFPTASDCSPTEIDTRGEVKGLPHDESAYKFAAARRTVGHAGLFSTADDLLTYAKHLLGDPDSAIVRGARSGLGWTRNESFFMGKLARAEVFGKTGFTGASIVIDIERQLALVILSNRTYPKRPADAAETTSAVNHFRSEIADIVSA